VRRPDIQAVERAAAEFDRLGRGAFMEKYQFADRNITYEVEIGGKRYPSKALFGAAFAYMPNGEARNSETCDGTEAREHLARLGLRIVDRRGDVSQTQADRIRDFVITNFIEPARQSRERMVEVVSGDVHTRMGLEKAMPAVCGALEGRIFAERAKVTLIDRRSPIGSDQPSSTIRYRFGLQGGNDMQIDRAALERLRDKFLSIHHDFKTFDESPSFASLERDYKHAVVLQATSTLAVEGQSDEALGAALIDLLAGRAGVECNLIDWRAQKVIDNARTAHPGLVEAATGRLARAEDPVEGVVAYLATVWPVMRGDLPSNPYAESRMFPTMLRALVEPDEVLPIRSIPTDYAARLLLGSPAFANAPLARGELERVNAMAREVLRIMDEDWNWNPRDMWDVQGFLWVTCKDKLETPRELDPVPVWMVTSLWGQEDGLPRFVERGDWSLLTDTGSANNRRVREMQAGDRIFLKDFIPRARDLPFDAGGGIVTAHRFRAEGTITEVSEDRLRVGVDWTPLEEPRRWFFYTNNDAVWRLRDPGEDQYADRLRRFLLEGEEQDIEWFLDAGWRKRLHGSTASDANEIKEAVMQPTNIILYGPPGTGKTYRTALEAVRLCDGSADFPDTVEGRDALMVRYRELVDARQIEMVTFHQSFSYEEFVEGLRPEADGTSETGGFNLKPESGVFARLAERAQVRVKRGVERLSLDNRAIFKMSLGQSNDPHSAWVFEESLEQGYSIFGFRDVDWSDPRFANRDAIFAELEARFPEERITSQMGMVKSPDRFRNQLKVGDVIVASKGLNAFRAIGIVEGEYEYAPRQDGRYSHRRKVAWLWSDPDGVPVGELSPDTRFSLDTIYELPRTRLNLQVLERLLNSASDGEGEIGLEGGDLLPHVLIIDEINRANVSKVFGELITLIEPDKRLGMPNALKVRLPYSKREFGVPANLHIIGTMNTADRSIALLDTALRRRFRFDEMAPDTSIPAFIAAENSTGLPLGSVLNTMNRRIEYLVDRDHRIGHAFFIGCETKGDVDAVMRDKVIPLLQEYFFDDWNRLAAVLGEKDKGGNFLTCEIIEDPMGEGGQPLRSWRVRSQFDEGAYVRLVSTQAASTSDLEDEA